ncbi:ATP-binding cassette domain-containing protein [Mycoplasmopsis felis]|uniref:ABC transporter ATP-binding protein n=1 Tax=Mycoplasmopsis felis TaxID=33923 RepID=UPI002AF6A895|nr:ATP-binding cassette domain-containing protein [Mycoplasmopsis felis]WQQ01689.1 ATP-binding cassette domain-containing protein [Mycoplasmopsis felis]
MKEQNAIEFIEISKYFGQIKANQDISFEVKKGTIHALIGENGAGKSTLMSILFGLYEPDKGVIKVNNKEVLIKGPNDANRLGIGMVHQHFKLVDVYTNLENIVLGSEDSNKYTKIIDYKYAIKKIQTIQETFNLHFNLNNITGKETVATQQKVEIMKMLYRDSEILIFDEPTAVLTDQEIQGLLETFKLFRKQGKTILFISHKLGEIKEVADNATVLRHGKITGNFKVADVSIEEMANKMVGGEVEIARNEYSDTSNNPVVLKLNNISTSSEKPLKNVSLEIKSGEILAIAGVEGNGQTDLEYVISGMIKPTQGEILLSKTDLNKKRSKEIQKKNKINSFISLGISILSLVISIILFTFPTTTTDKRYIFTLLGATLVILSLILMSVFISKEYGIYIKRKFNNWKKVILKNKEPIIQKPENEFINLTEHSVSNISRLGVSFIPSDRHKHGLVLDYNIKSNTILRRLWDSEFVKFAILREKSIVKENQSIIQKYDVRGARNGFSQARQLSGGNQQKFIVGREMNTPHDFILIVQPTRGLDVGAIKNIHEQILDEKTQGKAILLISYELDEVLALADKIAVINGGEILAIKETKDLTRTEIGVYMAHKKEGGV